MSIEKYDYRFRSGFEYNAALFCDGLLFPKVAIHKTQGSCVFLDELRLPINHLFTRTHSVFNENEEHIEFHEIDKALCED